MKKLLGFIVLALIVSSQLFAQSKAWKVYSTATTGTNGIAYDNVHSVVVDKKNNIWTSNYDYSSPNHVCVMDSTENWQSFFKKDMVYAMCAAPDGKVWVSAGIIVSDTAMRFEIRGYDGTEWKSYTCNDIGNNVINTIGVDSKSNVWVSVNGSMLKFDGTNWNKFDSITNKIGNDKIRRIFASKNTDMWLLTITNRLIRFDGTTWNEIPAALIGAQGVKDACYGANDTVWVLTGENKLFAYKDLPSAPVDLNLPGSPVTGMAFDDRGYLFIATEKQGIFEYSGKNLVNFNQSNSLIGTNNINGIVADANKHIWIATDGEGLMKFLPKYTEVEETQGSDFVISVYPNPVSSKSVISLSNIDNSYAELYINDLLGNKVAQIFKGEISNSNNTFAIDNAILSKLNSGTYFITFKSNTKNSVKPIVIEK